MAQSQNIDDVTNIYNTRWTLKCSVKVKSLIMNRPTRRLPQTIPTASQMTSILNQMKFDSAYWIHLWQPLPIFCPRKNNDDDCVIDSGTLETTRLDQNLMRAYLLKTFTPCSCHLYICISECKFHFFNLNIFHLCAIFLMKMLLSWV